MPANLYMDRVNYVKDWKAHHEKIANALFAMQLKDIYSSYHFVSEGTSAFKYAVTAHNQKIKQINACLSKQNLQNADYPQLF